MEDRGITIIVGDDQLALQKAVEHTYTCGNVVVSLSKSDRLKADLESVREEIFRHNECEVYLLDRLPNKDGWYRKFDKNSKIKGRR